MATYAATSRARSSPPLIARLRARAMMLLYEQLSLASIYLRYFSAAGWKLRFLYSWVS